MVKPATTTPVIHVILERSALQLQAVQMPSVPSVFPAVTIISLAKRFARSVRLQHISHITEQRTYHGACPVRRVLPATFGEMEQRPVRTVLLAIGHLAANKHVRLAHRVTTAVSHVQLA